MNILILSLTDYDPERGGIESISCIITNEFIKLGHQVILLGTYEAFITPKYGRDTKSKIPGQVLFLPKTIEKLEDNTRYILDIINKNNIDVVLIQNPENSSFISMCKKIRKSTSCVLVGALHQDINLSYEKIRSVRSPLLKIFKRLKYNNQQKKLDNQLIEAYNTLDKLILLSESYFTPFKKNTKIEENSKLLAIPNCVYTQPSPIAMDKKDNILLFVGRLQKIKQPLNVLKIWKYLSKELEDWQLVVLGDGKYRKRLEDFIKKHCLRNITLLGQQPTAPYYTKAKAIISTSISEGYPLVLIEAPCYSMVTFTYPYSAVKDIVLDGITGKIIKRYNYKSVAKNIGKILNDKEYMSTMGLNAYNKSKIQSPDIIAEKWLTVFSHLLRHNK